MRDYLRLLNDIYNFTKSTDIKDKLSKVKKDYKLAITRAKLIANSNFILNSKNKSKAVWTVINQEVRTENNNLNKGMAFSPDDLNEFFVSTATNLLTTLPQVHTQPETYLQKMHFNNSSSFFLYPITENEVLNIIQIMSNGRSTDIFGISPYCLKRTANSICKPLSHIINLSFCTGLFPSWLKISKVMPIPKQGNKSDMSNYRPISLIATISKIFEIALNKRLIEYFEENKIFQDTQFGFRPHKSTTDALLFLKKHVLNNFEIKSNVNATLCDLSKAFDCVDHKIMLHKLEYYGIRGTPLQLIQSYLCNRKQFVVLNGSESSCLTLNYGVPQGSHLGPTFFLIYTNDIAANIDGSITMLYADDTTIINNDEHFDTLFNKKQSSLNRATNWFSTNKLTINNSKNQDLIFSLKRNIDNNQPVKLLGVLFDAKLTWSSHIDTVCKKLSTVIYKIRKLTFTTNNFTIRTSYFALFHSIMNYAIILWGNASTANEVFLLQKKLMRIMYNLNFRQSCRTIFVTEKILTFPCCFILQNLLYVKNNFNDFQCHEDVHSHNTRNKYDLIKPQKRLTKSMNSSEYLSLKLFNNLSVEIRDMPFNKFKRHIKCFLLEKAFYNIEEYFL